MEQEDSTQTIEDQSSIDYTDLSSPKDWILCGWSIFALLVYLLFIVFTIMNLSRIASREPPRRLIWI